MEMKKKAFKDDADEFLYHVSGASDKEEFLNYVFAKLGWDIELFAM